MKWRSCRKGTVDGMMIWQKYDKCDYISCGTVHKID